MWNCCRPNPLPAADLKNWRPYQRSWPLMGDVAAILPRGAKGSNSFPASRCRPTTILPTMNLAQVATNVAGRAGQITAITPSDFLPASLAPLNKSKTASGLPSWPPMLLLCVPTPLTRCAVSRYLNKGEIQDAVRPTARRPASSERRHRALKIYDSKR